MSRGLTLIEVLVVAVIVLLLCAIVVPSVGRVREQARRLSCATTMRSLHQALMSYVGSSNRRLPPFSFSSMAAASLPESGHWGGPCQEGDRAMFGRRVGASGSMSVNLWALVDLGFVEAGRLLCPAAPWGLHEGETSMFPFTPKFSSYCMRFPYSRDLFSHAPAMASLMPGNVLGVYCMAAGGQEVYVPGFSAGHGLPRGPRVPLVRMDRTYRIAPEVAEQVEWGDGVYDPSSDVLLADGFWWRDRDDPAPHEPDLRSWPIQAGWSHGDRFNVLTGGGAIRTVRDHPIRRPVEANSLPAALDDDRRPADAVAAERVWQFFDAAGDLD